MNLFARGVIPVPPQYVAMVLRLSGGGAVVFTLLGLGVRDQWGRPNGGLMRLAGSAAMIFVTLLLSHLYGK